MRGLSNNIHSNNNNIWNALKSICVYVCCPTIFAGHSSFGVFHLRLLEHCYISIHRHDAANMSTVLHNRNTIVVQSNNATPQILFFPFSAKNNCKISSLECICASAILSVFFSFFDKKEKYSEQKRNFSSFW